MHVCTSSSDGGGGVFMYLCLGGIECENKQG